jgi:hypothetical protein
MAAKLEELTILYWRDDDDRTTVVRFDAVTGLSPEDVGTPTSHPVERGVNVVDHVRDEPERLSIEGLVSSTPNLLIDGGEVGGAPLDITIHARPLAGQQTIELDIPSPPIQPDLLGLVSAGLSALTNALIGAPKATVSDPADARVTQAQARAVQQTSPRDRIRDVYEKLLDAKLKRRLVTVGTRDRDWSDMLITRVAAPRTTDTGATKFELDLERLRVADSETVEAPKPSEPRGETQKKKGTQTTKDSEKAEQIESTLFQGASAFGLTG